jgi:hypothetical protein
MVAGRYAISLARAAYLQYIYQLIISPVSLNQLLPATRILEAILPKAKLDFLKPSPKDRCEQMVAADKFCSDNFDHRSACPDCL